MLCLSLFSWGDFVSAIACKSLPFELWSIYIIAYCLFLLGSPTGTTNSACQNWTHHSPSRHASFRTFIFSSDDRTSIQLPKQKTWPSSLMLAILSPIHLGPADSPHIKIFLPFPQPHSGHHNLTSVALVLSSLIYALHHTARTFTENANWIILYSLF